MRETSNEMDSFHLLKATSLSVQEEEEAQDGLSHPLTSILLPSPVIPPHFNPLPHHQSHPPHLNPLTPKAGERK
jgi:hypothetical protein